MQVSSGLFLLKCTSTHYIRWIYSSIKYFWIEQLMYVRSFLYNKGLSIMLSSFLFSMLFFNFLCCVVFLLLEVAIDTKCLSLWEHAILIQVIMNHNIIYMNLFRCCFEHDLSWKKCSVNPSIFRIRECL